MKAEQREGGMVYTLEYIPGGSMQTAKIFMNGKSQAVRLPKEFRFDGSEVYIKKVNGTVVLTPKGRPYERLINAMGKASPDFMSERIQPPNKKRMDI
jgi:antitoxin VapB